MNEDDEEYFNKVILEIVSKYPSERVEKMEKLIYHLNDKINECSGDENNFEEMNILFRIFCKKVIEYMVENYHEYNKFVSSTQNIYVPEYIHIFCCLIEVNSSLLKDIVSYCVEKEKYQLITNMFSCTHPNLTREMFKVFRENLEYLTVFPKLPLNSEFKY